MLADEQKNRISFCVSYVCHSYKVPLRDVVDLNPRGCRRVTTYLIMAGVTNHGDDVGNTL